MKVSGQNISFSYESRQLFTNVHFEMNAGQISCIAGPNGVGKSTLLKCLCNFHSPATGVIYLDGKEIAQVKTQELARLMGYVPQQEKGVFSLSVFEAVLLGRRPYFRWRVSERDLQVVSAVLQKLEMTDLAERELSTLSGGERQKVAIARALAQEPVVLLLDEPTASLDLHHQIEIMELVRELAHSSGVTVVVILHDLNLAARYSDWIYLLGKDGIHAAGTPEEVFTPEKIGAVYGVEVEIVSTASGWVVVPVRRR